jgi:hypothetical protein
LDAITVHARAALGSIVSECASLNVLLDMMIGNLLFGSHRESVMIPLIADTKLAAVLAYSFHHADRWIKGART